MADRPEMFRPTRGFSGWPIRWNHAKCCGPTLVAIATKFRLDAEIQSPTGLFNCLLLEGASPNISWIVPPRSASIDSVYDDYDFDDDDDPVEGGEDEDTWTSDETDGHSEALSCIGVRRLCLRDASCRHLLHDFRQYCVENTNIHQCVTTHWFVFELYIQLLFTSPCIG